MGVNISPATPYVQIHDIQSHQTDLESPQMEVGVRRDKSTLLKGMLLALISGILFTANNFVLVYAAVSPLDAVLVRGLVHSMVLGLYYRSSIWCEKVHLVILQGVCAAVGLICALYSVTLAPVPDALTIMFTSPLSTLVLAAIFLGNRLTMMKGSSICILLLGVLCVCKPSFIFNQKGEETNESAITIGLILAAVSSFLGGLTNVLSSYCKNAPSGALVFWIAVFALVLSAAGEQFLPGSYILTPRIVDLTVLQWAAIFGMTMSGLVAYLSLTKSLQLIDPTLVSSLRSLEIILAFGVQSLIDQALPDVYGISGALLVCLGISVAAFEGWLQSRARRGYQSIE